MLKIDRVVSVSSEDPAWPAENLLKEEGKNSKWKCKTTGERSATVVVQLNKASKIKSIDVGNENSAFIEILVGKSCVPDDSYKVLLVASSLMSLKEAKDLSNSNGVRFFKDTHFCKPEAEEKWDRIKIVCSQPYNKHIQFGLSFIKFHGDSGENSTADPSPSSQSNEKKVVALGRFLLKEEKDDDITAGSVFARRKELQTEDKTSAVAIRNATNQLLSEDEPKKSPAQFKHTVNKKASPARVKDSPSFAQNSSDSAKKHETSKQNRRGGAVNDGAGPSDRNQKTSYTNKTPNKPQQTVPTKRKLYRAFSDMMRGVVFTISGFQNPLRGDIRCKALAMGAKYRPDWDNTCTHLVCAFANTPKFNQVKGHGKIVKKEWIENSYSQHIRFPWRRFALDPPDTLKDESEEEIFEGDESQNNVNAHSTSHNSPPSEQDSQPGPSLFGDIPKLNARKRKMNAENDLLDPPTPKKKTPKKNPPSNPVAATKIENKSPLKRKINMNNNHEGSSSSNTIYLDLDLQEVRDEAIEELADTDSDKDWMDVKEDDNSFPLPYLPEQFDDLSFYIAEDFSASISNDLKRYIVAHCGSVQENCSQDTEYVIADKSETVNKLKEEYPQIIAVQAEWVWRCHDENRLLPTSNFEL